MDHGDALVIEAKKDGAWIASKDSPNSSTTPVFGNSFFDNKGAVAGVFSVVGLIVLALLFALFFTILRRRRAKKFDREIEAAAREAAAAQPPAGFLDDDDDDADSPDGDTIGEF